MDKKTKRLVVVGGGAAGFFCAVHVAQNPDWEVVIMEKTHKLLSKVAVSGGGRCNVTHACFHISELVKNYPRGATFLKKAFHHFFTKDTIEWFEQRGVPLKTEADGRMFPQSNNSASVIKALMDEANKYQVKIILRAEVKELKPNGHAGWKLLYNDQSIEADAVCITSGGYAKMSSYQWLEQAGISIVSPVPSLFTINAPADGITSLMGISMADVVVSLPATKFQSRGAALITHWGLSGPAVLKLSALASRYLAEVDYKSLVYINWVPAYNETTLQASFKKWRIEHAGQKLKNSNLLNLPDRLWLYLLQYAGINAEMRRADLPSKQENKLIKAIVSYPLTMNGKTTFKEEFVTAGGVDLQEVDANTMQSRKFPGLYFAGEVLDIDGVTGGFNFQNAWTTGFIAAKAILHQSNP